MSKIRYVNYDDNNEKLLKTKIVLKQYNTDFKGYNIVIDNCLLDEGSSLSYINYKTVKNTEQIITLETPKFCVSNTAQQNIGYVSQFVQGNIYIPIYDTEVIAGKLFVLRDISHSCILGLDILKPIRKSNNLDPAYTNNIVRNPVISYSDIMVSIDAEQKLKYIRKLIRL